MYGNEMIITPDIAKQMLEKNTENFRAISWRRVDSYAADMKAGLWQCNGEAITFGKNGKLQNGQHRLHAIIKADMPIKMFVIYDADDEAKIYDCGFRRNVQNYIEGVSSAEIGAARLTLQILGDAAGSHQNVPTGKTVDFTKYYINELYKAQQIVCHGIKSARFKLSAAITAAFVLLLGGKSEYELKEFFKVANTMLPLENRESTPPLIIRRMVDTKMMSHSGQQTNLVSCIFQAFEDFENGIRRTKSYVPNTKYTNCVLYAIRSTSGDKFLVRK